MNYQLHEGDCLVEMAKIADGSVDMICADLPYGVTSCAWDSVIPFDALWKQYKRVIKSNGAIVLFASQPFTSALVMSNPKWFKYRWVWDKHNAATGLHAEIMPMRVDEEIVVFGDGALTYNPQMEKSSYRADKARAIPNGDAFSGNTVTRIYSNDGLKYPKSIIRQFSNADQTIKVHPTQKPVALLEYLIKTYTNEGETVLDNCFGSGSCGVAAMRTKRRFVGIEQDAGYFAIGSKQIADAARAAAGLPKVLQGSANDISGLPMFAEMA